MDIVIGPDTLDVSLYTNGLSLDVDMEVRMLVVSEALVVTVVMLVRAVTLVMVAMVQEPNHLVNSI
jgi:hypothetical protein